MSDLGDSLACGYDDAADKEPLHHFKVPELNINGKPLTIYHKVRTVRDADKVRMQTVNSSSLLEPSVYVIINEALDEKGKPLFDVGDKLMFMEKMHPETVFSIANRITSQKSFIDIKKK